MSKSIYCCFWALNKVLCSTAGGTYGFVAKQAVGIVSGVTWLNKFVPVVCAWSGSCVRVPVAGIATEAPLEIGVVCVPHEMFVVV